MESHHQHRGKYPDDELPPDRGAFSYMGIPSNRGNFHYEATRLLAISESRDRRSLKFAVLRVGTVAEFGAVFQDALRTRFIENWCKVVQTGEHSKPLLRRGSRAYPPVRGLWWNGLLIRRLHVQVVPGVRMSEISAQRYDRSSVP